MPIEMTFCTATTASYLGMLGDLLLSVIPCSVRAIAIWYHILFILPDELMCDFLHVLRGIGALIVYLPSQ